MNHILNNKTVVLSKIALFLALFSLIGCASEKNYRGVPSPVWEHLTAEQKQLVVDRAYHDEMKKVEAN